MAKQFILRVDDVGRASHRSVFDLVLWAMEEKVPLHLGVVGCEIRSMPNSLRDILVFGVKSGFLKLWNHGYSRIRFGSTASSDFINDVVLGHNEIVDRMGVEPTGFAFSYRNCSVSEFDLIASSYPDYFILERDCCEWPVVTPELNSYANGQPDLACFVERLARLGSVDKVVVQVHPCRWSSSGFAAFKACIAYLQDSQAFSCVFVGGQNGCVDSGFGLNGDRFSAVQDMSGVLADWWRRRAGGYSDRLSNFISYFLARYERDALKNWAQLRKELYPFRPARILDVGCGLGNWSLPFSMGDASVRLVLNDINATICEALSDGVKELGGALTGVSVDGRNLLERECECGDSFDFLICANTFNYLDPGAFFGFAKDVVVQGGRLLLMVQTSAFNRMRYKSAMASKDRSVAVEVLQSEFATLMAREFFVTVKGVRHVFSPTEIVGLAFLHGFSLEREFVPYAEMRDEGDSVYECLVFKKDLIPIRALENNPSWRKECEELLARSFGSSVARSVGVKSNLTSIEVSVHEDWRSSLRLNLCNERAVEWVRSAIDGIVSCREVDVGFSCSQDVSPALIAFKDRVEKMAMALR